MDYNTILKLEPKKLLEWMIENFSVQLPSEIITVEDMNRAGELLLKLSANYSYICTLLSASKIAKREAKRNASTEEYQDMVDRSEIIQNMTDIVKQQYAAVSRAVTIHIDNNTELRMNSTGGIRGN